jgi:hypothetical protein
VNVNSFQLARNQLENFGVGIIENYVSNKTDVYYQKASAITRSLRRGLDKPAAGWGRGIECSAGAIFMF